MTSMKKSDEDPYCSETNVKFSTNRNADKSSCELNSSIHSSETKEGVKVMLFSEFDSAQAVREYETIQHQDQILKGLIRTTHNAKGPDSTFNRNPGNPTHVSKPLQENNNDVRTYS